MSNIFHQSVEDILRAATPEQKILWNYIFLRWGERVAISQFYHHGLFNTGELTVYSANKIYIAYQLNITGVAAMGVAVPTTVLYNELNAEFYRVNNDFVYWDATAAAVRNNNNIAQINNIWFARLSAINGMNYGTFIGYRIGI